jgi:hypothetical protein
MIEFVGFGKIPRYSREVVVSEKIDGTSGTIYIDEEGGIFAASRTRWIDPEHDNHGFAKWVQENREELFKLGPGWHRGEWWGQGIQRNYGLKEKRFSLFNVKKWRDPLVRPACCSVVPVLWQGDFGDLNVPVIMVDLWQRGSMAAPGFIRPEGIVIYHTVGNVLFKKTFEDDDKGKEWHERNENS